LQNYENQGLNFKKSINLTRDQIEEEKWDLGQI
jgi:hypothetical protein